MLGDKIAKLVQEKAARKGVRPETVMFEVIKERKERGMSIAELNNTYSILWEVLAKLSTYPNKL